MPLFPGKVSNVKSAQFGQCVGLSYLLAAAPMNPYSVAWALPPVTVSPACPNMVILAPPEAPWQDPVC